MPDGANIGNIIVVVTLDYPRLVFNYVTKNESYIQNALVVIAISPPRISIDPLLHYAPLLSSSIFALIDEIFCSHIRHQNVRAQNLILLIHGFDI